MSGASSLAHLVPSTHATPMTYAGSMTDAEPPTRTGPVIELRAAGVTVHAPEGEREILRPTTLTLREHRIALIGPNGSGKSTLARLLNGLIEPSTGAVLVHPAPTSHAASTPLDTVRDGAAVRRHVGFMFTNPAAQLVMPTVIEDVTLSLRRTHKNKADRLAAAHAALDRFGLGPLAERSVHSLSGGQQQLLALASVLATDPAILIADEPTTLLDLGNARLVADTFMGISQQVVVATHDLELAARCDRVLVIEGGGVAYDTVTHGHTTDPTSGAASTAASAAASAAIDWYRSRV